jgi:ketosteroid isomerase-like protein
VLENDGRPLQVTAKDGIVMTAYDAGGDEQCFIAIGERELDRSDDAVQSSYGWLRPIRSPARQTFIYPRNAGDPSADIVRDSYSATEDGFKSAIATVSAMAYVGRTSAGGEGRTIDINADGTADASFNVPCQFMLQLRDGKITAVETDREVVAAIAGRQIRMSSYTPVKLGS